MKKTIIIQIALVLFLFVPISGMGQAFFNRNQGTVPDSPIEETVAPPVAVGDVSSSEFLSRSVESATGGFLSSTDGDPEGFFRAGGGFDGGDASKTIPIDDGLGVLLVGSAVYLLRKKD